VKHRQANNLGGFRAGTLTAEPLSAASIIHWGQHNSERGVLEGVYATSRIKKAASLVPGGHDEFQGAPRIRLIHKAHDCPPDVISGPPQVWSTRGYLSTDEFRRCLFNAQSWIGREVEIDVMTASFVCRTDIRRGGNEMSIKHHGSVKHSRTGARLCEARQLYSRGGHCSLSATKASVGSAETSSRFCEERRLGEEFYTTPWGN